MKKIRTIPRHSPHRSVMEVLLRRKNSVRAGTGKLALLLAAALFIVGRNSLPAKAAELPEELREYGAEEIRISGTDEDSITQEAESGGAHVKKTLRSNRDGTLQIDLESWVTGTAACRTIPVDVVLVLDTSSSMGFPMTDDTTRIDALRAAANQMIDDMEQQNQGVDESLQSRIAIVNYSNANISGIRLNLTRADAQGAEEARAAINSLSYAGRTRIDEGMRYAKQVIDEQADAERNRVVILYTDGVPNHESQVGFVMEKANQCIATARQMKESGVKIFTITVEPLASSVPGEEMPTYTKISDDAYIAPFYNKKRSYYNTSDENGLALINRFMYLISSDNPHAQDMDTPNAEDLSDQGSTRGADRETYYYTAAASSALKDVFRNIVEDIGTADMELNGTAQAQDEILAPFSLNSERGITVSSQDYLGNGSWGVIRDLTDQVSIEAFSQKVIVSGFDYAANYVSEDPHVSGNGGENDRGRKLIISFTIQPQGTFGGNHLPTNSTESGLYQNGEAAVLYPVPAADIRLRYQIGMRDQRVYVPDKVQLQELITREESWTADGSRNAYVDIACELQTEDGETVGTLNIPAGKAAGECEWSWKTSEADSCGRYVLICRVSPAAEGHFTEWKQEAAADVHVFHPELSVQDTVLYYKDPVDVTAGDSTDVSAMGDHLLQMTWKCADETPSLQGEEPRLGYRIALPRGTEEAEGKRIVNQLDDIPVIVGVYRLKDGLLGEDITEQSRFAHSCKKENCAYDAVQHGKTGIRFLIHVKEKPMQEKVNLPNTGGKGTRQYLLTAAGIAGVLIGWKILRRKWERRRRGKMQE